MMESPTRQHFKVRYKWFKYEAEDIGTEKITKHLPTFDKWIKEIERSCVIGITNGFIEGCNRLCEKISVNRGFYDKMR